MLKNIAQSLAKLSPRPWGWTVFLLSVVPPIRVVPTPVGMDRRARRLWRSVLGCPHARGDGPEGLTYKELDPKLSPRPWGWTGAGRLFDRRRRRCPHARGDGPYGWK